METKKKNKNPDILIPEKVTLSGLNCQKNGATSQDQGWQFISVIQKLHPPNHPPMKTHQSSIRNNVPKRL